MDQDHRVAREFVYGVLYNSRDLSTAARRQIMQKLLKCIKMSGVVRVPNASVSKKAKGDGRHRKASASIDGLPVYDGALQGFVLPVPFMPKLNYSITDAAAARAVTLWLSQVIRSLCTRGTYEQQVEHVRHHIKRLKGRFPMDPLKKAQYKEMMGHAEEHCIQCTAKEIEINEIRNSLDDVWSWAGGFYDVKKMEQCAEALTSWGYETVPLRTTNTGKYPGKPALRFRFPYGRLG